MGSQLQSQTGFAGGTGRSKVNTAETSPESSTRLLEFPWDHPWNVSNTSERGPNAFFEESLWYSICGMQANDFRRIHFSPFSFHAASPNSHPVFFHRDGELLGHLDRSFVYTTMVSEAFDDMREIDCSCVSVFELQKTSDCIPCAMSALQTAIILTSKVLRHHD